MWDTVGAIAGSGVLQISQLYTKVVVGIGFGELEDRRLAADLGNEPRCDEGAACHLQKTFQQVCVHSRILVGR